MAFFLSARDNTRQVARTEPLTINHVYEELELCVDLKLGL